MCLADVIGVFHCRARSVSLMKSGGYHGPACQAIRLSWPNVSSEKLLCARPGETGLAVVLSTRRPIHRGIEAGMLIADQRPENNPCSVFPPDLLTLTKSDVKEKRDGNSNNCDPSPFTSILS